MLKCDCGADKARTSHALWCSSLKPDLPTPEDIEQVFNSWTMIDTDYDPPEFNSDE